MKTPEEFVERQCGSTHRQQSLVEAIRARDAEWQARIAELEREKSHLAEQLTAIIARRDISRERVREVLAQRRKELCETWLCMDHGGDEGQLIAWHLWDMCRLLGIDLEDSDG